MQRLCELSFILGRVRLCHRGSSTKRSSEHTRTHTNMHTASDLWGHTHAHTDARAHPHPHSGRHARTHAHSVISEQLSYSFSIAGMQLCASRRQKCILFQSGNCKKFNTEGRI